MNSNIIKAIEQIGLVALASALGYLSTHATEISPDLGPLIGATAAALLVALNRYLGSPVVSMLSKGEK